MFISSGLMILIDTIEMMETSEINTMWHDGNE